jgi:hypothetical protein
VTAVIQTELRTRAEGRLIPMQKMRWVSRSIVVTAAVVATQIRGLLDR